jgi:hypothetical protein
MSAYGESIWDASKDSVRWMEANSFFCNFEFWSLVYFFPAVGKDLMADITISTSLSGMNGQMGMDRHVFANRSVSGNDPAQRPRSLYAALKCGGIG